MRENEYFCTMNKEFSNLEVLPGSSSDGRLLIAGPCSAESSEQMLSTAWQLAEAGVKVFRAGIWKPRTHPGGFEGMGEVALEWLAEVKHITGMLTATEVATSKHLESAIDAGVDMVWIGARTSANPFAVQEIADALASADRKIAVLVKNPINPDIELWIGALQRIYRAGITCLGAIHRGFSTYGDTLYRNNPHWGIPIELHRRFPQLPIVCDPSHIAGRRDLVETVALQAVNMSFDGLIVECHVNPECALSDKDQQLTPAMLVEMMRRILPGGNVNSTFPLDELRSQIDRLDNQLLEILANRMSLSAEIGKCKRDCGMTAVQPHRYASLIEQRLAEGKSLGLDTEFVNRIWGVIHEESVRRQIAIIADKK